MKKAIIFILIVLMMLPGCSGRTSKGRSGNSFVPVEDLSLPVSSSEIVDAAQIEDKLFIIAGGKVLYTNLTTGESGTVCSTDCTLMCAYDGVLHLFDSDKGSFSVIDSNGEESDAFAVSELSDLSGEAIKSFGVCDEYYVVQKKQQSHKGEAVVITRKTKEVSSYSFADGQGYFCSYKDNRLLFISSDLAGDKHTVSEFNAETGKYKKLCELDGISRCCDCLYDGTSETLSTIASEADGRVSLMQTDLSEGVTKAVYRPDIIGSENTEFFIAASDNITSIISSQDNEYRYYDINNPPENITFVYMGDIADITDIIKSYESQTGVIVTAVHYSYEKVEDFYTKMMAEDIDFDCFYTKGLPIYVFPTSGKFVDLYEYDGLKERIQSNALARVVSEYDGKCFGLPVNLGCFSLTQDVYAGRTEQQIKDEKEFMELAGIPYCDNPASTYRDYLIKNIDLSKGSYSDPKGEELYEVLRHLYEHPEDSADNAFYPQNERKQASSQFIIINSASPKTQLTAEFLTYIYDYINREDSPRKYPTVTDDEIESMVVLWKYNENEVGAPILDAKNAVTRDKMGRTEIMESPDPYKEIEKLAKEAAAEVAMRIGE